MKLNTLLIIAAIYLALVGIGLLLVPDVMLFGALGATAPALVVAVVRGDGAALLGIATINAFARDAAVSPTRHAIALGNFVGFGLVAITQALGALGGAPQVEWLFVVVDALFAIAFLVVGRANTPTSAS